MLPYWQMLEVLIESSQGGGFSGSLCLAFCFLMRLFSECPYFSNIIFYLDKFNIIQELSDKPENKRDTDTHLSESVSGRRGEWSGFSDSFQCSLVE